MKHGLSGHIAMFLPSLRGGGAERVMVTLAKGFIQKGLNVDLVLAKVEGPYIADLPREVRVVDLGKNRVLTSLWPLIKYLRQEKPSALLSTMGHANIIALVAKLLTPNGPKVVVREAISIKSQVVATWRGKIIPILVRFLYQFADAIIANSTGSRNELVSALGKATRQKVHLVYNPMDLELIQSKAAEEVEGGIVEWLNHNGCPLILGMGRLTAQKDFQSLIRSFFIVRKKMVAKLLIIGEGDQREELEKLVRELDIEADVRLPGFIKNPYPLLKRASVFVLSSRWEGLPNALLEAIAVGTPVVSTDCPSGPDEILEHGRYGRLVPVGDQQEIARAIFATLRSSVAPDVLCKRAEICSLERIVEQYIELLFETQKGN